MAKTKSLSNNLLEIFINLITEQTGLMIKEGDRDKLYQHILTATQAFNLKSPENYYQLLASSHNNNSSEWQQLINLLTNNESYFFRDQAQINLLAKRIFPDLIQRQQNNKTLRICSAGCSTGEEPYTLAIILKELIPNFSQWKVEIIAIDIDDEVLKKAAAAIYSPWSFRGVEPRIKQQYFELNNNRYHLNLEIKKMVVFKKINLVNDCFDLKINNIDLFICRNVFIYFPTDKIATVLDKIYNTLKPEGYLLTGHTELAAQDLSCFKINIFDESVIYQRSLSNSLHHSNNLVQNKKNVEPISNLDKTSSKQEQFVRLINSIEQSIQQSNQISSQFQKNSQTAINNPPKQQVTAFEIISLSEIEKLIEHQQSEKAIAHLQKLITQPTNQIDYYYLLAKVYADRGQYQDAIAVGKQALHIDVFAVSIYYLLAQIQEELGNFSKAKELLKKIIYLEPSFVAAYLTLSQLYQQEGDLPRSYKMRLAALNLLKQLPQDQKIQAMSNVTVQELISQLGNKT